MTLVAALALAGCQGNGGAVSARWMVVDLTTGATFDPRGDVKANDGLCCPKASHAIGGVCDATSPWIVQSVGIQLRDPSTGDTVVDVPPSPCTKREETTDFDLPEGTFAIGLSATVTDGMQNPAPVQIPPPEVRTIVRGEVVNLQIIEIGVNPLPLPTPSTGVTF